MIQGSLIHNQNTTPSGLYPGSINLVTEPSQFPMHVCIFKAWGHGSMGGLPTYIYIYEDDPPHALQCIMSVLWYFRITPSSLCRLLPYYSDHAYIRKLIDQCDLNALRQCAMVPTGQLYLTPGMYHWQRNDHRVILPYRSDLKSQVYQYPAQVFSIT